MTKLTKKNKITIAVSVIVAAVLIFSITMFSIWANVEVYCKQVDYETLQNKLGDYFIVPSGIENEIDKTPRNKMSCRVYFPKPDEGSKHRYGKYTNLTFRYKYATGYTMSLGSQNAHARILVTKGDDISPWIDDDYDIQKVDGVDVYYKLISDVDISKVFERIEVSEETWICFVLDGAIYQISTSSGIVSYSLDTSRIDEHSEYGRRNANDYARYLFDKLFIVDSDSL